MNAINKQKPEPHDDDRIGDVVIPAAELERVYQEQKAERSRLQRRERIKKIITGSTIAIQSLVIAGLVATIVMILPLKKLVTVVVYQRDDGTVTNTARWETLPKQVREDTTVNVVWSYVQQRESWSAGNAGWAWTLVSAMSSPKVREAFQAWYRADNPQSPYQTYKDMTVEARFVRWEPICPVETACLKEGAPAYRIWFDRVETNSDGKQLPPVRYAVTVGIKRNVPIPEDRIWQRWTFNAPQIQVIEYPGAQREGVSK